MNKPGKFVISLDFELLWGAEDEATVEAYAPCVRGVHAALPRMLEMFEEHGVGATFCTVGFVMFDNKADLLANLPARLPSYEDRRLSPYNGRIDRIRPETENCYFAPHLVREIAKHPRQEIGTHTLSHYYGLVQGQTAEEFRADLEGAIKVAARFGIKLTSLVFPRNQVNPDYLPLCRELGLTSYRGNESSWLYRPGEEHDETLFRRAVRLMDSYLPISGRNCYSDQQMQSQPLMCIPSSRYLRPFAPARKMLEALRLWRIKSCMSYAAKTNRTFHLWWHPYNFGLNQEENFGFLRQILAHYRHLNQTLGFESVTMGELARRLQGNT